MLALVVASSPASSQPANEGSEGEPSPEVRIRQLERRLLDANRYIQQLAAELQALKAATGMPTGAPAGPAAARPGPPAAPPTPGGPPPGQRVAQVPPPAPPREQVLPEEESAPEPVEEQPEFTPAFLREARAVLIRRGLLEIDARLAYGRNDRNFIAARGLDILENFFIGPLLIGEVNRDNIRPSLSLRYGVADRLQINASVPYRFQYNETFLPPQIVRIEETEEGEFIISEESSVENWNHGIGDVEFGLSYHLLRSRPYLPDTIFSFGVKTRTGDGPFDVALNESSLGTGFWGVRGGLTFVRVSDPASLFANVGYFYHIPDEVRDGLDFDPADSLSFGAGVAYALNPFLSLTTQFNVSFVSEIEIDGQRIPGSSQRPAELSLGVTYGFGNRQSADIALSFGLTNDSPDLGIAVSIPFTFTPPVPWAKSEFGPLRRVLSF